MSEKTRPLVSVVMPTHNSTMYLRDAITSVLDQEYGNLELLLIDDGSSDDTVSLCKSSEAQDRRVRFLQNPVQGAGGSRNMGIDNCLGEFILFLDSDDVFYPNMISTLVDKAMDDKSEVVICDYERYIERNASTISSGLRGAFDIPACRPKDLGMELLFAYGSAPWNKLFSRCLIDRSGARFQNTRYANDVFGVFSLLLEALQISFVEKPLLRYRVGMSTNTQSKKDLYPCEILQPVQGLIEKYENEDSGWRFFVARAACIELLRGNIDGLKTRESKGLLWDSARSRLAESGSLDVDGLKLGNKNKAFLSAFKRFSYDELANTIVYRMLSKVSCSKVSSHLETTCALVLKFAK